MMFFAYRPELLKKAWPGLAIGPVLFVVAILAILVGALAAGNGGFGNSSQKDSARVQATSIMQQGNSLKWGFERLYGNAINVDDIVVSVIYTNPNSPNSLYGKDGGGLLPSTPLKAAVPDTGVTTWRFVQNAVLPDVGTAAYDTAVVIGVRTLMICQAINATIFGRESSLATTIPVAADLTTATLNEAGCTDSTMASTGASCNLAANSFDASGAMDLNGRAQACVEDGAGNYYYYQLLLAK